MSKKIKSAYSLIELSIVILIISILITGALSVSVSSVNNSKVKITNDRMAELYKALGNYVLANGKLPCPANILLQKSVDSTYGTALGVDGTCGGTGVYTSATVTDLVYGMVPVKALNLPSDMAEDGFEGKIAYMVDKRLTAVAPPSTHNPATGFSVGFVFGLALPTPAITMREKPANNDTLVDFALISYGANKSGGYGINGTSQITRSGDLDELENDTNTTTFNALLISSSGSSDVFDDIVFGKKRTELVVDFNAMRHIKCTTNASTYTASALVMPYGQTAYALASCLAPNTDKRITMRCDAFGQWVSVVAACP